MNLFVWQYGDIEEMNICDNLGDHLVGNVYVKVSWTAAGVPVRLDNLDCVVFRLYVYVTWRVYYGCQGELYGRCPPCVDVSFTAGVLHVSM